MSAKLVVQKFETDISFKYLNVTIEGDHATRFGEWLDGESQNSKKGNERSSHLVVKIVSGREYDHFDLDSCAKELNGSQINDFKEPPSVESNQFLPSNEDSSFLDAFFQSKEPVYKSGDQSDSTKALQPQQRTTGDNSASHNMYPTKNLLLENKIYSDSPQHAVSPLEHSLERVKATNVRIMENIRMLNRTLSYTKKKELLDNTGPKSTRSYPCDTCGKCFVYETGLRRHYTARHSLIDVQPRWQVVWTCIECFQVWPRQDVAMQHATQCCRADSADGVREIKTSSLLQCEFCEKVFTSIPRLLRHAKTHSTTNNYECNACEMAFKSYKIAENHWLSCPWLKACYTFYLPKLLLCNACDRKFRNYEQLYNHRYKVGHFMTKTFRTESHIKTLGILVYQCEICGQWFPSVGPLQAHKMQYHPRYDGIMQTQNDLNYKGSQPYSIPAGNGLVCELEDITNQQY